jgi:hypothetical protein
MESKRRVMLRCRRCYAYTKDVGVIIIPHGHAYYESQANATTTTTTPVNNQIQTITITSVDITVEKFSQPGIELNYDDGINYIPYNIWSDSSSANCKVIVVAIIISYMYELLSYSIFNKSSSIICSCCYYCCSNL